MLSKFIESKRYPAKEIGLISEEIHRAIISGSRHVRAANFTALGGVDLRLIFSLYDAKYFEGLLARAIEEQAMPLSFEASSRLTSNAGKVTLRKSRLPSDNGRLLSMTLSISSTLLFQTFQDVEREIVVNGLSCRDRLQALQRVFEHELIHVAENLAYGNSSCKAPRFRELANRFFAHTGVTHQLVTQVERSIAKYRIGPGDMVRFEFEGRLLEGRVNRITRRATILVEDPAGLKYSDGKVYLKYYIPLDMLQKI